MAAIIVPATMPGGAFQVVGASSGGGALGGPGDVVSGAKMFWGPRSYTTAGIGGNALRVVRASDSGQTDIVTVTGGGLDTATLATYLTSTTGKVVTQYNQVGTSAYDATQGTDASRPVCTLTSLAGYPGMTFAGAQRLLTGTTIEGGAGLFQPFTICAVAKRTGAFSNYNDIVGMSGGAAQALFYNSANRVGLFAGTLITPIVCSDSTYHSLVFVFNGSSSVMVVDGSATTVDPNTTHIANGNPIGLGNENNALTGVIMEAGIWPIAFNSTQYAAMDTNMRAFYGL